MMRRFFVAGSLAIAAIQGPAVAQQVTASQIAVVGLEATTKSGKKPATKLNASYENLYWRFTPMSDTPRTVDLSGDVTLAGPRPGVLDDGCDRSKGGRIFYSPGQTLTDQYQCRGNSIETRGTLTRRGDTWTFEGRLDGAERSGADVNTWVITEDVVLKIVGERCTVVKAAVIWTVHKGDENSRLLGETPSVSRKVSSGRTRCAFL